jgi:hypothetical protein
LPLSIPASGPEGGAGGGDIGPGGDDIGPGGGERGRGGAAEAALARAGSVYRQRYQDINSMLSAVDGTLLVLARHRHNLPAREVDRLMTAARAELWSLRNVLADAATGEAPAPCPDCPTRSPMPPARP